MKKFICGIALLISFCSTTALAAEIPDHKGTDISGIAMGTATMSTRIAQYNDIFKEAGDQYGIDPNILAAICMQESSGKNIGESFDEKSYPAWGIMQVEYTNEKNYAAFGLETTGTAWTLNDRLDPVKEVPYAAYLLSESLYKYDCDYAKMLTAYNYGDVVMKRILDAVGDNWMAERVNAKKYVSNWPYNSYGDAQYVEHVLRYLYEKIDYVGAKVRLNGSLVKFENQYPIIEDGTTLIPVRAVGENLGATVDWDQERQLATIQKGDKTIQLFIGSIVAYINGEECRIDVPAEVVNNRTMVPLRFIAEAFDTTVEWDGTTRTVELSY